MGGGLSRASLHESPPFTGASVRAFSCDGRLLGNQAYPASRHAGNERLIARYGERLVCVRYLYDEMQGRRLKTVELVIEETPWRARPRRPRHKDNALVAVRIAWNETGLRAAVKKAGATWHPREKIWEISWEAVRELGIGDRVSEEVRRVSRAEPYSGI